jgi:hypothetical protein
MRRKKCISHCRKRWSRWCRPTIAPARELSRAYRYIRKHHWRMAIIYLDHLEKKYPHWGTLFLAKAMAYLGMHETDRAISALSSACYLGDQEACL